VEVCRQELAAEFEAWWTAEGGGGGGAAQGAGGGPGAEGAVAAGGTGEWSLPAGAAAGEGCGSRRGSAVSLASSALLGGLPPPGGGFLLDAWPGARSAASTPQHSALRAGGALAPQQPRGGAWGGAPPAVPLASIVAAAEAQAQGDAAAAAYFQAQQGAWLLQRAGSGKQHRGERGTFSSSQRGR
jgi:hypothetical protein